MSLLCQCFNWIFEFLRAVIDFSKKTNCKYRTIFCVWQKNRQHFGSLKTRVEKKASTFTWTVGFFLAGQRNRIKIVLQWHSTGASPKSSTITSTADLLSSNGVAAAAARDLSMTVPMQRGSMAVLPSRSRFMITDILGGGGAANVGAALHLSREHVENGGRSPSPENPRDLSASAANNNNNHLHHLHHNLGLNHHHLSQHNHMHRHDEDSDSSGPIDDDNSVCSNGKCSSFFGLFFYLIEIGSYLKIAKNSWSRWIQCLKWRKSCKHGKSLGKCTHNRNVRI